MELGQPVYGRRQQLGPRVLEVVPARVVGRVPEPEVGPQVDDRHAVPGELVDPAGRGAVGQRQEHGLRVVRNGVVDMEVAGREVGVDAAQGVALPLPPDKADDAHVRVQREEPDQLGADVPRRAHDRHPHGIAFERPSAARGGGARIGQGIVRTVRRDRRARRVRAHRRARPLAGGRLEGSEIGRSVVTE